MSAVVGGLLVVGGELITSRRADRRRWQAESVRHAAAIVANKRHQRELAKSARSAGRNELSDDERAELASEDRLADSLFFLSPVSEELRTSLRALITASNALRYDIQCSEADWRQRLNGQKQAIYDFEALMRLSLGGTDEKATVRPDGSTASPR